MTPELFLGLISGTSADGIDAVLVRFLPQPELLAACTSPYPGSLRERLLALMHADRVSLEELGQIDVEVADAFADAALALLKSSGHKAEQVRAIGSHGQTVRHRPFLRHPFTLQLGDPHRIAERTGICTVADFRRRDVAAGGQGAPLVCALHAGLFAAEDEIRAVLNLGGIANLTLLEAGREVLGFDTGPANALMDLWATESRGEGRDEGGAWAASGRVHGDLLAAMLGDPYFALPIPKSTGREHFHRAWLGGHLAQLDGQPAAADVQATLAELSAQSIVDALARHAPAVRRVLACGGGVHNRWLMTRIGALLALRLQGCSLDTTAAHGLDPDFVEATAFAWLARETLAGRPGNCASVTGARGPRVLGAVCQGRA